jgi:hypothetical protein
MRAALPCYRRDNSLLGGIEFPVIFLGNLTHKCRNSARYSAQPAAKHRSKIDVFPVNSLITGNFKQRPYRAGLRTAPALSIGKPKSYCGSAYRLNAAFGPVLGRFKALFLHHSRCWQAAGLVNVAYTSRYPYLASDTPVADIQL